MRKIVIISVLALILSPACSNDNGMKDIYKELKHQTYMESKESIANPERGFYSVLEYKSPTNSPMTVRSIQTHRLLNKTIIYTGYYLTDYMESDIAPEYLELIRGNMQALREGGAKCVLRFAYKDNNTQLDAPYDPTPEWVDRHIQSIKPILQEYGDVILCFQAGFVGVWGEWYYTSNFVSNPQTIEQHALRKRVTDAMLDALPADRQIALRTPMFKATMYADKNYTDTLTLATAYDGSDRARISCFNDCFGASSNDRGTFQGDPSREYWKKESKYVLMGGETCEVSNYCTCENSLKDMKDYHWTYLNSNYHLNVIARWRKDGCMSEIDRRLGYRLTLSDVYHTPEIVAGNDLRVVLKINNTGFAAPMNPRAVEFVFIDGDGKKTVFEQKDIDPRYWFAGETATIDRIIKLPADASGSCKLYLNLPDPESTLHDNPLFSIRLANDDIWDEEQGYNKILEFLL